MAQLYRARAAVSINQTSFLLMKKSVIVRAVSLFLFFHRRRPLSHAFHKCQFLRRANNSENAIGWHPFINGLSAVLLVFLFESRRLMDDKLLKEGASGHIHKAI